MKTNTQPLKGFRDFLPQEKYKRDYVLNKIKEVFKLYGFDPLETPTLERAEILTGKYGDEADKLVYLFNDNGGRKVGLKYDQTVPTARVLSGYRQELPKFFRRYQIQPVFRAEKPQKGRFREFLQCDIDIFGTKSFIADAEILACTYFSLKNIGFSDIKIYINDRDILYSTLNKYSTNEISVNSIIQSIDKLDKKPKEQVILELTKKGLSNKNATSALRDIESAKITNNLEQITNAVYKLGVPAKSIVFSPILARGLDYYTGMIFEVKIDAYSSGSLGGGGRYDNLINLLGGVDVPAVGMAFGFDRVVEAATELNIIPDVYSTKALVCIVDKDSLDYTLKVVEQVRELGVSCALYPQYDKLGNQISYALKNNMKYVIIAGSNEMKNNSIVLKDLKNNSQIEVTLEHLKESLTT